MASKGITASVAGDFGKMPGSAAKEGTFVPEEAKKIVEEAATKADKPAAPVAPADTANDTKVVEAAAKKQDAEV